MRTLLLLAALSAPTLSLPAQSSGAATSCSPLAPDTARFGGAPVYAACEIQTPAKLKRNSKPRVEFPNGVRCLIAELEFVVDETGAPVPATAIVLMATTPAFGDAVRQRLGQWRYAPATRDGVPVRQLVVGRLAMQDESRVPFVVGRPGEPAPSRAPAAPCQ
ncbi:MAG: energy transducer TonB [Gemmatimonadetes bacterium]|nr:energy transducer TonB [Gemmatimonadota bacterium]